VNQIGEERDRAGEDEDGDLQQRRNKQHSEADRDRLDPCARADDRGVDKSMRVAAVAMSVMRVRVVVSMLPWMHVGIKGS
jgi:hypothetical protein